MSSDNEPLPHAMLRGVYCGRAAGEGGLGSAAGRDALLPAALPPPAPFEAPCIQLHHGASLSSRTRYQAARLPLLDLTWAAQLPCLMRLP